MNTANLDPRIGYLNSGKFYAYVGADRKEVMGTREQVETALGLAPTVRRASRPARREFIVTVTPGVVSWNCKAEEVRVDARTHADAIKTARAEYNENAAWTNGAATYRARLA